jgi:hypothetical protein
LIVILVAAIDCDGSRLLRIHSRRLIESEKA